MAKFSMKVTDVDTTQRTGGGRTPDGLYEFEVDEVNTKDHHDKRQGYELAITLLLTGPEEYAGRKAFLDCNVLDPEAQNPDWEKWGREALGRLLRAVDWPEDKDFDDESFDELVGMSGIVKIGLDEKRSKQQGKPFTKVWGYIYPEDAADAELGPFATQVEFKPEGERQERPSRERNRVREERGRESRREERQAREERSERRLDSGRGREDEDVPFNEEDAAERPRRGGGDRPWGNRR